MKYHTWQNGLRSFYMVTTYRGVAGPATPIRGSLPKVKALLAEGSKPLLSDDYFVTGAAVDSRVRPQGFNDLGWAMTGRYQVEK